MKLVELFESKLLPRVLVALPCYNEQMSLPSMISRLQELGKKQFPVYLEFCIINDGSEDGSENYLAKHFPG